MTLNMLYLCESMEARSPQNFEFISRNSDLMSQNGELISKF